MARITLPLTPKDLRSLFLFQQHNSTHSRCDYLNSQKTNPAREISASLHEFPLQTAINLFNGNLETLLNRPSICMGPLIDSNPNMAQNSILHQNHTGTTQTGKTYIPSEVLSPLLSRPTANKIFIHESLNPVRPKAIILNKEELVFYKEKQTISLSS